MVHIKRIKRKRTDGHADRNKQCPVNTKIKEKNTDKNPIHASN